MNLADLADVKAYGLAGVAGGALAVLGVLFLLLRNGPSYVSFFAVVAALGAVLGLVLAYRIRHEGVSVNRLGWAAVTSAVSFSLVTAIGFCSLGWAGVAPFALQFPVSFVLVLLLAAAASALSVRWWPKAAGQPAAAASKDGAGTSSTEMKAA